MRIFICVTLLGLSLGLSSVPAIANQDNNNEDSSARLQQVSQDIEKLKKLLNTIKSERSDIENRLEKTEKQISKTHNHMKALERQLNEAQQQEKKHKARQGQLNKELILNQQAAAKTLRAAYLAGQNPQLKVLLNQEDPAKTSRMMVYYQNFTKAQAESLQQLQITERRLVEVQKLLSTSRERITQRAEKLKQQQQKLRSTNQQRSRVIATLKTSESGSHSRLQRLQSEQRELQTLLESIISIAAVNSIDKPFRKSRGKIPWPVPGKVTHKFGERRQDSSVSWNGVFIRASAGTAVKAPHHGRVVFSNWMKSFGQLIIIDHGSQYMTLYAHNQQLMKDVGDWVVPGDIVALVGDTGGQPESGLYFEIRYKGKPANPLPWLASR